MNICMSGYAGDLASRKIYEAQKEAISLRFSKSYIKAIEELPSDRAKAPDEATQSEVHLEIEDGLYQTLWRLGEELGTGLEIRHELIPIKQETIELCELEGVNPYEIPSSGVVYVLPEGELPLGGVLIGKTHISNDRVVIMKSVTRYLNKY